MVDTMHQQVQMLATGEPPSSDFLQLLKQLLVLKCIKIVLKDTVIQMAPTGKMSIQDL